MITWQRILLGACGAALVGSLAAATFWPEGDSAAGAASDAASRAAVSGAPAADVVAPSSSSIFPKVLNH